MSTHPKIIKHKIGLLHLAEALGNVSQACKVMGYSRDTFYQYQQAVEAGGFEALVEQSRWKQNLRNRVAPEIEEIVVTLALEQPALGQVRVSNELRRRGQQISPAVRRSLFCYIGSVLLGTPSNGVGACVAAPSAFSGLVSLTPYPQRTSSMPHSEGRMNAFKAIAAPAPSD